MERRYNLKSPAVKRLMREARELSEPTEQYYAQPLEDNLFEWHFTIRGPLDSEFAGGIYHGRIVLPPDYPMKPPSIIILTPNGRFEIFKKICLSISGHHPESWQPSWSIRTALLAIIGFMPTHGNGAIGSLDYTPEERKKLAKMSQEWKCPECGNVQNMLQPVTEASEATRQEAKELAQQINFQAEKEKGKPESPGPDTPASSETSNAATAPVSPTSPPISPAASWMNQMPPGIRPFMPMMPGAYPPTSSSPGAAPPSMPPPMMMYQMMAMMNAQAAAAPGARVQTSFPGFPQVPGNTRFPIWPPNMPSGSIGSNPIGQGARPKATSTSISVGSTSNISTATTTPARPTTPVASSTTSTSTSSSSAAQSEVRQRAVQPQTPVAATPQPTRPRAANSVPRTHTPAARRRGRSHNMVIPIVIIGLLFLLLLIRRLYMMGVIKLEQDTEDM